MGVAERNDIKEEEVEARGPEDSTNGNVNRRGFVSPEQCALPLDKG